MHHLQNMPIYINGTYFSYLLEWPADIPDQEKV